MTDRQTDRQMDRQTIKVAKDPAKAEFVTWTVQLEVHLRKLLTTAMRGQLELTA